MYGNLLLQDDNENRKKIYEDIYIYIYITKRKREREGLIY